MILQLNGWLRLVISLLSFPLLLPCRLVRAQTFQFLPEIDTYSTLQRNVRFNFQVKETREAGDPTQAEIGPSFDFFLKPLAHLKRIAVFDQDDSKARLLQLSIGYRYVPSADKPDTQRLTAAATPKVPFVANILLSDRNRIDLDWSQSQFTWRYRNRLGLERRLSIGSYHPAPYVSAEIFYESKYRKWDTTAIYAGWLLPIGKQVEFDAYYEHQNVTTRQPNQQYNQFGLILNLYLSRRTGS